MPSLEDRLAAGLLAQDWDETASRSSSWRRFGKFGRGAMYVLKSTPEGGIVHGVECAAAPCTVTGLAFSELCECYPADPVKGPILEQVLLAGDKSLRGERPDTEALLIELMYLADGAPDAEA